MNLKSLAAKMGGAVLVFLAVSGLVRIRYIMSTWTGGSSKAWAADHSSKFASTDTNETKLTSALQKRLLVPNPSEISLGAPKPGPLPGMNHRTVTINGAQGQKFEIELFSDAAGDKGILTQQYADFDIAHPWQHVDMKLVHLNDRPTLGQADAPVTIVEFADFECPFCARAFGEIETVVNTTYKGKVRLIWKNFPLNVHPWAEQAAIAADCAWQQNPQAFWTFARDFYRDQAEITPQNLRSHIDGYASATGLDQKALNACILGNAAESVVEQDKKDGQAIHVNSTPTFLVNGVPVVGLPSSNVFDFVITGQMRQARNESK
jgi:protein-disulfide isomerase